MFQTKLNNIKTKMLIQKRLRNTEACVTVAAKDYSALPNLIGELKLKMVDMQYNDAELQQCSQFKLFLI